MRPNIRVEIQNNLVEPMEVEEEEQEEGEIPDGDKEETSNSSSKHSSKSPGDVPYPAKEPTNFAAGFDLFDKHEMEKLQKRAQRFQLKPDEIKNFTDEDLVVLKKSLGISSKNEVNVKPNSIMMHGLDEMTPEDILDYFLKYAPVSLEWLNDESCNVVWSDQMTAARALHFSSKPVRGMPVRNGCSYVDGLNEVDGETGESALFKNANREVELQEDMDVTEKPEFEDAVDISEVPGSIPPGYWRLGTKHAKSKCLLLRFALKTDMQPFKVELLSRYYKSHSKKYGKEEPKHSGIFARNKAIKRPGASAAAEANPWSSLAENWDEDVNFRERERVLLPEEEKVEIKSQSLKVRLGSKRKESDDSDSGQSEEVVKRTKIPRMRMYADEEEEKIKKKKLLNTINQTMKQIESDEVDLRRVLSTSNRKPAAVKEEETFDLGTKLKSRRQKMVFEVKTEHEQRRPPKENTKSSRHSARSISPPRYRRSPERDHRRSRRRSRSRQSRRYDDEDDDYYRRDQDIGKPKSKVAVVIKTVKRPTVASAVGSTVWSRINRPSSSSSESSSKSSSSSSSEEESEEEGQEEEDDEEEEIEEAVSSGRKLFSERPGFRVGGKRLDQLKAPLKIEINNDHFNKKNK